MKRIIVKLYNENIDTEEQITIAHCETSERFCAILCNHFADISLNSLLGNTHKRIFIDDIEIISYEEYDIVLEYIYECYYYGHKIQFNIKEIINTFIKSFATNKLIVKGVKFNK